MPPISVLIKPASSQCNLKCQYCFYHDIANRRTVADFGRMSPETLEVIIRKALQFATGQATFSFQGGEPTLCGLDFFKSVVSLQAKYNVNQVKINNCLQTNGLLIDAEWARFLGEQHFLVGLSLDGPPEFHDKHRVDAGGHGTHDRVLAAAARLDEYQVEYNILFVVTNLSARYPDELYSYFKRRNFNYLQFMPCLDPHDEERGGHRYSLSPDRYTSFLKRFFEKWSADFMNGREVSVRYFDNLVRMVMGLHPEMCSLLGACQCQFVLEADGSVYPCDFYVTDEWKLGRIQEQDWLEMYESETCRRFIQSSLNAPPLCRSCQWKTLCRGGCRRDRESGTATGPDKNYFCESYSAFLACAYPRLIEVAQYVRQVNARPVWNSAGSR